MHTLPRHGTVQFLAVRLVFRRESLGYVRGDSSKCKRMYFRLILHASKIDRVRSYLYACACACCCCVVVFSARVSVSVFSVGVLDEHEENKLQT